MDFTEGSIVKKLIKFMVPILGALVLQAMYGAVDLLIVGRFGTDSGISGVATGTNIVNLVTFVAVSLAMGATVLISNYLGEKRNDKVGHVIGGAIFFFSILTVVLTIIMLLLGPVFATLLNAPAEAFDETVTYVRVCGVGMIFVISYNLISSIFRGLGNSKLPLVFVAIACVVNILGDLLFVAVLGMNVMGAALATVIAQAVSVLLSLIIIRRQKLPFTMKKSDIRYNSEVPKFLKLGAPIVLQEIMIQISFLALCAIVNNIGLDASSGYGIAQKVVTFVMLIPSALMQSMSAFVGQNVGAGKEDRAKKSMFIGMFLGMGIGVIVFVLTYFRGDLPASIFTDEVAYIGRAAEYLRGFSIEAVLTCVVFSFIGYFNGHGKTLIVMIQGITSSFLFRLPLSYLFSLKPGATLFDIGLAVPYASIYGIIFFITAYLLMQRKMKKNV